MGNIIAHLGARALDGKDVADAVLYRDGLVCCCWWGQSAAAMCNYSFPETAGSVNRASGPPSRQQSHHALTAMVLRDHHGQVTCVYTHACLLTNTISTAILTPSNEYQQKQAAVKAVLCTESFAISVHIRLLRGVFLPGHLHVCCSGHVRLCDHHWSSTYPPRVTFRRHELHKTNICQQRKPCGSAAHVTARISGPAALLR